MTTSDKKVVPVRDVLSGWVIFIAVLVASYPLSAIVVSVLARRGVISLSSPVFATVEHIYDPFFAVIYHIPGADDAFARLTCWLAGVPS